MLEYIGLLIIMLLLGMACYVLGDALVKMMDYGNIFWRVRKMAFNMYANMDHRIIHRQLLETKYISSDIEQLAKKDAPAFKVKSDMLNSLYDEVPVYAPAFKLYICANCLSHRLALILGTLTILTFVLCGFINWKYIAFGFLWLYSASHTGVAIISIIMNKRNGG